MKTKKKRIDVEIRNCISLIMVAPLTRRAKAWVKEYVEEPSPDGLRWMGGAFACELRYAGDLVAGMREAGLKVA